MKACPTCKRTYADETLTFCLVDGSILSAPYDPHETLRIPSSRVTDPAPTEILNPTTNPSDSRSPLLSTIQSPQPPPLYSAKQQAPPRDKQSGKPWMAIPIIVFVIFIVAGGSILSFLWLGRDRPSGDQSDTKVLNTNVMPSATPTSMPTATPLATVEDGGWGPRNDQASLNNGERLTYYPGTTPEKCQADCDKYPNCRAYTLIRAGFYKPTDPPMCYLMSVANDFTPSPCCISAVKR